MPKVVDRQEREETLMVAAMQVFADQGYHGATMQAIANHAGVSKGGVYDYFSSKEALLVRTAEWFFDQLIDSTMTTLEESTGPIPERLERFACAATSHLEEWTSAAMILIQVWAEMGREDGPLRSIMSAQYVKALGRLQTVLDSAVATHELPPFDTRSAAVVMLAAMDGAVLQSILLPVELRAAVTSGAFIRLCVGLLPSQQGGPA